MAALAVALFDMPYGYYVLLRILICGACIYLANVDAQMGRSRWAWLLGGLAVLYNPIFKIHLGREIWWITNLATIWFLAIHMWSFARTAQAAKN